MKFIESSRLAGTARQKHTWRYAAFAIVVVVLLCGSLIAWGAVQQPSLLGRYASHSVRNFGVVWPEKLDRSGKPYSSAGWQWMHDQGVRSIVTLIKPEKDKVDYSKFGFEKVLRIGLEGQEVPTDEQTKEYLAFIQDPKAWPVDVHCSEGKDRTGMMIALARYAIDGWTLDQALAEAKLYRGDDLARFRIEWLKKWTATHPPGSERKPSP